VAHNFLYNSSVNGIYDLAVFAPTPGPRIEHNTLVDCEIGIFTASFIGPMDGRLIHQNSISQDGLLGDGQSCIVANQLNEAMIRANSFEGDYAGPLVVLSNSSNGTLLQNRDLRPATPAGSPTYYLDVNSSGNLVLGASGTAVDDGTNNQIFLMGLGGK
jgi:hypothetical protein